MGSCDWPRIKGAVKWGHQRLEAELGRWEARQAANYPAGFWAQQGGPQSRLHGSQHHHRAPAPRPGGSGYMVGTNPSHPGRVNPVTSCPPYSYPHAGVRGQTRQAGRPPAGLPPEQCFPRSTDTYNYPTPPQNQRKHTGSAYCQQKPPHNYPASAPPYNRFMPAWLGKVIGKNLQNQFRQQQKAGAKYTNTDMSGLFHDHTGPALPDHMLQLDLLPPDGHTNHMMYEHEQFDKQSAVLSPCASTAESTGSYFDNMDPLRGLSETSDDLLDLDVFSSMPPIDPADIKMEEVFQLGKRALEGPTLNALNTDQSVSALDEAEAVLGTGLDWNGYNQTGWIPGGRTNGGLYQSGGGVPSPGQRSSTASSSLTTLIPCTQASVPLNICVSAPMAGTTSNLSMMSVCSVTAVTGTISFVTANKLGVNAPGVVVNTPKDVMNGTQATSTIWSSTTLPTPSATVTSATITSDEAGTHGRGSVPNSQHKSRPTTMTESKWEEIKQFIHDDMELNFNTPRHVSKPQTAPTIIIKPEVVVPASTVDDDMDCADSYDDDSDADSEFNVSFNESDPDAASFLEDIILTGRKEKRYFWQYNTQSKGPKGKRLCKTFRNKDPHVLNQFEDPVFDPELNQNKYKHNGKARRGDGNDVNANPWKLYQIGRELAHLGRQMNGMVPVSEMPSPARSKTRKEKNKYASRACRLKKKAQHEAHKLKLHGLHQEHAQLLKVLKNIRAESVHRVTTVPLTDEREKLTTKLDSLIKDNLTVMIAGHTSEYVNSVLENIAKTGDRTGGLRPINSTDTQE